MIQRVVLLGLMCSGKSSVGAALARRLEWGYLDFDVEIERREHHTIQEIVASAGEGHLRLLEGALTEEAAATPWLVLAPGGGWITQPELMPMLGPETLSVWLQVSPPEIARRLQTDTIDRPWRDHPEPAALIADLLHERLPLLERASLALVAEGRSPEAIAFEIERVVRAEAP